MEPQAIHLVGVHMGMRPRASLLTTIAVALAFFTPLSLQESSAQEKTSAAPSNVGKYNGPGGCAASNCHGSVTPRTVTRIRQTEYSIWAAQDKHSRAYNVLSNPVSVRIGKILKLENSPSQSEKCLACHALSVPADLRAQTFRLDDGVSCENCHGPAVGWLGPHTTRGWTHEQSVRLGMYDTRDLIVRSQKCLTCHVGTAEKYVDHEMIAAGHPDLTFELDTFSAVMPRHWRFPQDNNQWEGVQEWAVGQAVQLREALNRLSRNASSQKWPEFGELDCFACHHSLTRPEDSWRQASGYHGRKPGAPPWNASRYIVLRHMTRQVNPDGSRQLDAALEQVSSLVGNAGARAEIAAAAQRASGLAGQLAEQLRR